MLSAAGLRWRPPPASADTHGVRIYTSWFAADDTGQVVLTQTRHGQVGPLEEVGVQGDQEGLS